MKILEATMQPLTLVDLKEHYDSARCLVLEGNKDKFLNLVTLQDIERRLNDGCNANIFAQVIKDGARSANVDPNCVWAPGCLQKSEFVSDLQANFSFMMPNSSQISKGLNALCHDIETLFVDDHIHADVHLYVSMNDQGNSYNAHRDSPQHKILLQAYGDANWQIFEPTKKIPDNLSAMNQEQQNEYLQLTSEFTLSQGDMLYMPPGTFHRVVSVGGPRISISIPFFSMPTASKMDRTYIPFTQMFENNA